MGIDIENVFNSKPVPFDELPDDWFCRLDVLVLQLGKTPAQLATAIEEDGIDGYDRFGRQGPFSKESFEAKEALEVLADHALWQARWQVDDDDLTQSPAADFREFSVWSRLGWPKGKLLKMKPDVGGTLTVARKKQPRTQDTARIDKTNLHIIGALLTMIEGKYNFKAHPEFENRAALVTRIAEEFKHFRGLGTVTLRNRLYDGEDVIEEST
ncbi:hypothetical protein [Pseudorhodoferax sp. Leaf267]|uniref:hypothetical protein n=1 Tax=Pseudorhodoferax sp. Leaf267 TaxID=1736316 RepID=UPI0006F38F61|nr:hypothetical protein [Pseudorhodoferax sp. Leaf267]KQP22119.1 hypothetical protein ASF43_25130 [Pseudorhodoferax sp. Leaf267]